MWTAIYGEKEAGGTSVLYLSAVPFEKLGFPEVGTSPSPRVLEGCPDGHHRRRTAVRAAFEYEGKGLSPTSGKPSFANGTAER